ncbi:hypothetical protein LOY54_13085 [Pseudomonas sp. B21-032]|uniref:hypothetical protein n=1 Tax=Pseudomonas sp. B21-032 TaxID=2895483 RepID=UPI002160771D|nr:hypothetical protein [Pseudomonas sp. B21-032]UVL64164.1 hypothetical protein LOY54_13085 [Pseudomonas sp. B21-032]
MASWYREIAPFAGGADQIVFDYYASEKYRQILTEPLEYKVGMASPERLAKCLVASTPTYWLHHPGYISERDGLNFAVRQKTVAEACRDLEVKYLSKHFPCMQIIDALTDPFMDVTGEYTFCPVSLAYALLRLKLDNKSWPSNLSFWSCRNSGISNLEDIVSPLGRTSKPQELTLFFLHILGELQFMVTRGKNFLVICSEKKSFSPRVNKMVYLRRTPLSFRRSCQKERPDIRIARYTSHGPLFVILNPSEVRASTFFKNEILVI